MLVESMHPSAGPTTVRNSNSVPHVADQKLDGSKPRYKNALSTTAMFRLHWESSLFIYPLGFVIFVVVFHFGCFVFHLFVCLFD